MLAATAFSASCFRIGFVLVAAVAASACAVDDGVCPGPDCPACPGPECPYDEDGKEDGPNGLNYAAGTQVLYEVQVRSANACDPDVGADWQRAACRAKLAPEVEYRAEGMSCGIIDQLHRIKLGTFEDMLADTDDFHAGITLRYIDERVGATTVWLMPLFPNNDTWSIPDACDDLGSPYAVRDYLHAQGTLSEACILDGRDERSAEPCWGNDSLEAVIAEAHRRGLKVMLDVAFNHFGHNYNMYDYAHHQPIRNRIAAGEDLNKLWDYAATYEQNLVHPELLDTPAELAALGNDPDLTSLKAKCPTLAGDALVRSFHMWKAALDGERAGFPCTAPSLENAVPGFYLGADSWNPSTRAGDNFTNNWRDVKFLYHQETNGAHAHEYVRNREYLFRVMNYWVSRGVDGFRLDHTTEYANGLAPNEWRYITGKVNYYAMRRGQARPVYLAEEFHDQFGMAEVVDVMTEGYVGDMNGRNVGDKNTSHVEKVLGNMGRFGGKAYVMSALETHDEHRLTDGTGFTIWTGAGFWGIGATTWSTPMILMGQEFGEPWGLGFRRSDYLRSRFIGSSNHTGEGDALADYYGTMIRARLGNRSLYASNTAYLRTRDGDAIDQRIFAQVKWSGDGDVVFTFHNLWERDVAQSFYLDPDLADALWIRDHRKYRLFDVVANREAAGCKSGADLKWDFYVAMDRGTRMQWLRLEACE
jgi:glycosidase